jgi:hypothetical protein
VIFIGDLGSAEVMISNNNLNTVEEGVFKSMLEQMLGTGTGVLYLNTSMYYVENIVAMKMITYSKLLLFTNVILIFKNRSA